MKNDWRGKGEVFPYDAFLPDYREKDKNFYSGKKFHIYFAFFLVNRAFVNRSMNPSFFSSPPSSLYATPIRSEPIRRKAFEAGDVGNLITRGILADPARRTFGSSGIIPITLTPRTFSIFLIMISGLSWFTRLIIEPRT